MENKNKDIFYLIDSFDFISLRSEWREKEVCIIFSVLEIIQKAKKFVWKMNTGTSRSDSYGDWGNGIMNAKFEFFKDFFLVEKLNLICTRMSSKSL